MKWYAAPDIFFTDIQGFLVILDLRNDAYFILDPVGTSMWHAMLASDDEAEITASLQDKYAVEASRMRNDLTLFRRRCITQGFLQENEPGRKAGVPERVAVGPQHFLFFRAWWCLFRTSRVLHKNGLLHAYRTCADLPVPKGITAARDDLLRRSLAAFSRAENFFLLKQAPKDCMPRSLALFRFLRSVGLPVEHCIGVRRFPFFAHAWVEYRGDLVHDNPSWQTMFTTLARIPA